MSDGSSGATAPVPVRGGGSPAAGPAASIMFVGTATTVIRFGDLCLLTDPNFLHRGQRAYLGYGLSSKRLTEPALTVEELPELDGIVLSHLHGDHWDRIAHRGLDRDVPIVTTPHASRRLQWRGFPRATGLRPWSSQVLTRASSSVRVTAVPGRHAPTWARALLPPVMGSVLEFGPPAGPVLLRVYISGDTLLIDDLSELPARFDGFDRAILHLGGTTLPGGLMVTMNGEQGAQLFEVTGADAAIPVHHNDYRVFKSPLSDFAAAMGRRGLGDRVVYLSPGDEVALPVRTERPADARHPAGR